MGNEALQQWEAKIARSKPSGAMAASNQTRELAEVQAGMVMAHQFPRNTHESITRILQSCERYGLASEAIYAYPRGGQTISGPSIQLAKVLAQNWGNIQYGVRELEVRGNVSTLEAFCWDLETNTRSAKTFEVKHTRKARGSVVTLDDPRDVYEHVANYGARRMRACILDIVPRDVTDAAVAKCEQTLARGQLGADGKPLQSRDERIVSMVAGFAELGVSVAELEKHIGRPSKQFTDRDLVGLRAVFATVRSNPRSRSDFFGDKASKASDLADKFQPAPAEPEPVIAPEQPPAAAPTNPPEGDGSGPAVEWAWAGIPKATTEALAKAGIRTVAALLAYVDDSEDEVAKLVEIEGVSKRGAVAALSHAAEAYGEARARVSRLLANYGPGLGDIWKGLARAYGHENHAALRCGQLVNIAKEAEALSPDMGPDGEISPRMEYFEAARQRGAE